MALRYRFQNFLLGELEVRLKVLRDLTQYDDSDGRASAAGISEQAFPLFGIVWPSAEFLAASLLQREDLSGKRILEIGCGMALVSHALNLRGEDISAMDIHPVTAQLMLDNTTLNGSPPIPFVTASWSDETLNLGPFDLIVGSDILYEPKHVHYLASFMDRHLTADGEVLIVDPVRGQAENFEAGMHQFGFVCEQSPASLPQRPELLFSGTVYRCWRGLPVSSFERGDE